MFRLFATALVALAVVPLIAQSDFNRLTCLK
jgi:hypothetical protein